MASATEYDVITHVPWLLLIPRLPEMLGTDTLAIVMSRTAMKFAVASTIAASPERGSGESAASARARRVISSAACMPLPMERQHACRSWRPSTGPLQRTLGELGSVELDAHTAHAAPL
jgi:hypothetical protein